MKTLLCVLLLVGIVSVSLSSSLVRNSVAPSVWQHVQSGYDAVLDRITGLSTAPELDFDADLTYHPVEDTVDTEETPTIELLDQNFCGRANCPVVVPLKVQEQESKALILDRDLVLPNAAGSRYGLCRALPFSAYRDASSLARSVGWPAHRRIFTAVEYLDYAARRRQLGAPIAAKHVRIYRRPRVIRYRLPCGERLADLRIARKSLWLRAPAAVEPAGDDTIRLVQQASQISQAAMLVDWKHIHRIWPNANATLGAEPVAFGSPISKAADQLLTNFGRSLAIHWRCARSPYET